jgi:transcriptional adapter 2-alpha
VNFPLFHKSWEAEEELLLLEAIEKYGLGNWQDVADHIGNKTASQAAQHYMSTYIEKNPSTLLPPVDELLTTAESLAAAKAAGLPTGVASIAKHKKKRRKVKAFSSQSGAATSSKTISSTGAAGRYASAPVNYDMAGYMEQRREFEVEYNNDAELPIANLSFNDSDTPDDTQAKYKLLEIYNQKLAERYQRREFVISRGLMDLKRLQTREKAMYREDLELHLKLRPLMLVVSREDYEKFIDGLFAERSILLRIEQLQSWRAAGIRTLEEGEEYEMALKKRNERIAAGQVPPGETRTASLRTASPYEREAVFVRHMEKVPKPKNKPPLLDVSTLPDVELLGKAERSLCAETRLYPRQYLVMKSVMIKDQPQSRAQAKSMFKVESSKVTKVYEFMLRAGWLSASG